MESQHMTHINVTPSFFFPLRPLKSQSLRLWVYSDIWTARANMISSLFISIVHVPDFLNAVMKLLELIWDYRLFSIALLLSFEVLEFLKFMICVLWLWKLGPLFLWGRGFLLLKFLVPRELLLSPAAKLHDKMLKRVMVHFGPSVGHGRLQLPLDPYTTKCSWTKSTSLCILLSGVVSPRISF